MFCSGPQICPFCKKGFTEGVDLRRHLDANADEAPYNCGLCPEMFQQPCLLRKHQYEDHGFVVVRSLEYVTLLFCLGFPLLTDRRESKRALLRCILLMAIKGQLLIRENCRECR